MKKSIWLVAVFLQTFICSSATQASDRSVELLSSIVDSLTPSASKPQSNFPIKKLTVLLNNGLSEENEGKSPQKYSEYDYQNIRQLKKILETLPCFIDYVSDHQEFTRLLTEGKEFEFVLDLRNRLALSTDRSLLPSSITALMEKHNVKHSHSGEKARIACEDKLAMRQLSLANHVPSPFQIGLTSQEILSKKAIDISDIFPAFLKPRKGDGSFGICEHSRVESWEDLHTKFPIIYASFPPIDEWALQKYLPGTEYTVAVIGNGSDCEILPIATLKWEEGHCPFRFFDPQNLGGLNPEKPHYRLFIEPKEIAEKIKHSVKRFCDATDFQDCVQFDFRCDDDGIPCIIDANVVPWWGVDSPLYSLAKGLGYSYEQLIKKILKSSLNRYFAEADLNALDPQIVIPKDSFPISKLSVLLLHGFAQSPYESDWPTTNSLKRVLSKLPCSVEYLDDHTTLLSRLEKDHPEFVLDLAGDHMCLGLHSFIPILFDMYDIKSSKLPAKRGLTARNKTVYKGIMNYLARKNGIPCPEEITLTTKEILEQKVTFPRNFPVFLKPTETCASIGVCEYNRINSEGDFYFNFSKIHEKFPTIDNWVVQEYLSGPEYTVGVLGHGEKSEILPIVQLSFVEKKGPDFFTRDFKCDQNGMSHMYNGLYCDNVVYSVFTTPPETERQIRESLKKICPLFDCVDYVRFDFRCNKDGIPMLLDANSSPWWGVDGALYLGARAAGYSYEAMILKMLNSALERYYSNGSF